MKLLMSWLNDYVNVNVTPEELANKLTSVGFEVEEIYNSANITNVCLGKVLDIQPHKAADKLVVCTVDVGEKDTLTICTGATNLTVGDYVPVAKDGAVLPIGKTIKTSDLRGVPSQGMMCSPDEINMEHKYFFDDGILVFGNGDKFYKEFGFTLGTDICTVLGLDDYILDVSVPANRVDCHSVYGMAREVACVLGAKFIEPDLSYNTVNIKYTMPKIKVDFDRSSRYMAQIVTDIRTNIIPDFITERLTKMGVTVHDSVVDITNYVLLDVGQPMHAFDATHLNHGVTVRASKQGDCISALNDKEYVLNDGDCTVVASGDGNEVLAVGGIIGGKPSSTQVLTKDVMLESAIFVRKDIRLGSRKLNLRTDSSTRYEKGMSYAQPDLGMKRALHLIDKYGVGEIVKSATVDLYKTEPKVQEIACSVDDIAGILGIKVPLKDIQKILNNLGFEIKDAKSKTFVVVVPTFRNDIDGVADIAEEIIRYYGYDKLSESISVANPVGSTGTVYDNKNKIRQYLSKHGFYEIINFSFVDGNENGMINMHEVFNDKLVTIKNPLSKQQEVMRTHLVGGMLNTIRYNLNRKNTDIKLFEIGKVYLTDGKALNNKNLPQEIDALCYAVVHTNKNSNDNYDFYDLKAFAKGILGDGMTVEPCTFPFFNPYASCNILLDGEIVGCLGDVHPNVLSKYDIDCKVTLVHLGTSKVLNKTPEIVLTRPISKFLPIDRDLNVVVSSDVPAGNIVEAASKAVNIQNQVVLQDIYTGDQVQKGSKSVTLNITLHPDKTLQEKEISSIVDNILKVLNEKFEAKLRS